MEASINNAKNTSTGFAAAELVLGYRPRYTGNLVVAPDRDVDEQYTSALVEEMMRHHATALQCARDELNDSRDNFVFENTPSRPQLVLKAGDLVYVDTAALVPTELRDVGHKIKSRYAGPFSCISKATNGSYKIDIPFTSRAHNIISHKFVKKAHKNEFPDYVTRQTDPADDPAVGA